ncbi:MAG: YmdB family metallophosphoesterase [Chloroflexi bacterium]|nr:TIGR00282 family metallophosphoesterase [Chloroflexota bacterium]MXW24191.1 YmdB family metallophosphoesterase [Chloroflexota bacterium]MXZ46915.1 YmdB family metallophosphoesterase [Chloroflexota bacterium]
MRVLMVGDIVGRPGREAVGAVLPELRNTLRIDHVIANGENTARGRGLTERTANELFESGVDVITSGNHIFDIREFVPLLDRDWPVLRPANYPPQAPGRGVYQHHDLTVISLMGRVFMPATVDDPFRVIDELLEDIPPGSCVVVDFHAEASSEKQALSWYLDGRVSAIVGTHTHVPTADARVLPGGTASVGDLGMVGVHDSVIGDDVRSVIRRFVTGMPTRLPVAEGETGVFNSVLIEIDSDTGLATGVERVDREMPLW